MLCDEPENIAELHYLDNAAISPLRPEALAAMVEMAHDLGNPSSVHSVGRRAYCRLEECREELAELLGAEPSEVIFVGSGSEANNLALQGMAHSRTQKRILISGIEHKSISSTAAWLRDHEGRQLEILPVDQYGQLDLDVALAALAQDDNFLLSVQLANGEIGTIQPVTALAEAAADRGIPFHMDAVQGVSHLPRPFAHPGITTAAIASQKFGGPTGIGILLARVDAPLTPLMHGGGQERGIRPATQNLLGILGMTAALRKTIADQEAETARLAHLRERLVAGISQIDPAAVVNGAPTVLGADATAAMGLPNILSVCFPGCEGDALVMLLDGKGISASVGSACEAGIARASEVLLATGMAEDLARGCIRISMGYSTTQEDIDYFLSVLPAVVERARQSGLD